MMRRRGVLLGLAGSVAACSTRPGDDDPKLVGVSGRMIDNDQGWMDSAPLADPFHVEISFVLWDAVFTNPQAHGPKAPVHLPDLPRRERLRAGSREVEGHVAELAAYYRRGLAASRGDGETLYWLRLELGGATLGTSIGFAWWDTLHDMRPFLDWVERGAAGAPFDDLDQGWRVQAGRRGGDLCFRETNWEKAQELGKVRAPAGVCAEEARAAWVRTTRIVGELKRELGIDPWS